jgi:hypothetical protein
LEALGVRHDVGGAVARARRTVKIAATVADGLAAACSDYVIRMEFEKGQNRQVVLKAIRIVPKKGPGLRDLPAGRHRGRAARSVIR